MQREVGTFRSREVAAGGGQSVGVPPGWGALQVVRGQGKPLRRDLKAGESQVAHLREREARGALQGPLGCSGGSGRGGCGGRGRSEERSWGRLRLRGRPVVVSVEQVLDGERGLLGRGRRGAALPRHRGSEAAQRRLRLPGRRRQEPSPAWGCVNPAPDANDEIKMSSKLNAGSIRRLGAYNGKWD